MHIIDNVYVSKTIQRSYVIINFNLDEDQSFSSIVAVLT